jgi:uridine kinase
VEDPGRRGRPTDVATIAAQAARDAWAARPVVLVDGPSGAGNTTFARALVEAWPVPEGGRTPQLVSMDDLYPGWDGLAAGSAIVETLLIDLRSGYRRWDWERGRPGVRVDLDPDAPLIVEGCGALTPRTRASASLGLWLDADETLRRIRALEREPGYAPHWERWAAQERAHWDAHHPWELADLRL